MNTNRDILKTGNSGKPGNHEKQENPENLET